jgi:hypothetical protein
MNRKGGRRVLLGLSVFWSALACAQFPWEGVFMPGLQHGAERRLYADQATNTVYAFGLIRFDNTTAQHSAILAWRNNQWDTVLYDVGYMKHVIIHHDTLFVAGGLFYSIQGVPMGNTAYWANGVWHSSPVDSDEPSIERFRIIDDTLYACTTTSFDPVYRFVGGAWESFGSAPPNMGGLDIIKYQGDFYAAMNGSDYLLAKLVNGSWESMFPSLMPNISMAGNLVEYQGDLYIGGKMSMNEGLPGQGIFRYDGNTFHPLGSGLQTYLTNNNGWCGASDMVVWNGFLCVMTGCNYAGGIPVNGLALWDGQQWCSMPGNPYEGGGEMSITSLNDTLYVTCGATIAGEPVGYMARFVGPDPTEQCALATAVPEPTSGAGFSVSTTADHAALITGLSEGPHPYAFYDAQGRLVDQGLLRATAGEARIRLPEVVPALYVLRIGGHAAQVLQLPLR